MKFLKNKIEGTPILKLATTVKRLQVKKFVKKLSKKS
jgi:hypothetical protein